MYGEEYEHRATPAAELYSKALSLGVMSKAFGMAGLRIGWIACQDQTLLKKIQSVKHYTSICNSAPAEIISLIALRNKDRILARNNQIVRENLLHLENFLQEFSQVFSWVRPQGGCVGFVKYNKPESIDQLAERLVQDKGVLLLPASVYNFSGNYFRVGFGRKNMPEALQIFRDYISKHYEY